MAWGQARQVGEGGDLGVRLGALALSGSGDRWQTWPASDRDAGRADERVDPMNAPPVALRPRRGAPATFYI